MRFLLKTVILCMVATLAYAEGYKGTGVVKGYNVTRGAVTLQHNPIKELKWPAMTMEFDVRDKKLLERLKLEQKVTFEFVQEKSRYVVTSIK